MKGKQLFGEIYILETSWRKTEWHGKIRMIKEAHFSLSKNEGTSKKDVRAFEGKPELLIETCHILSPEKRAGRKVRDMKKGLG